MGRQSREEWEGSRYLRNDVEGRLLDRLYDIKDRQFPTVVDLGSYLSRAGMATLREHGTTRLIQIGQSVDHLKKLDEVDQADGLLEGLRIDRILADEEELLHHVGAEEAELVISNMALHWINDLPGTLIQVAQSLKPDGLFLGAMLGEDTLRELRESFVMAELEREGGVSPRTSPLAGCSDCGNLLQRAQFSIPTVDTEKIGCSFPSAYHLMHELGLMANAVVMRRETLPRSTLLAAAAIYQTLYGSADPADPWVKASFQVIYMTGWKPHVSQQKPLRRGSAQFSLKDLESQLEKKGQ